MSESLRITSHLGEYGATFVEDVARDLGETFHADAFLLIDAQVLRHHRQWLDPVADPSRLLPIDAGEDNKTLGFCGQIIAKLIEKGVRKQSRLVVLGGGITQDIGGFVSSILYRGTEWVFWPTSLLAQADSCIGSKTSINLGGYKNLVGTFYPPKRVYIAAEFLRTLPLDAMKSGIGEMLHYFLLAGSTMASRLADEYDDLLRDRSRLGPYVRASLEIKKAVIEQDEFDRGIRNLFNYGHSFGHAIEAVSKFTVNHGQAVTMGMDIANYISMERGELPERDYAQMRACLLKNMPDFELREEEIDAYLAALARDKKNVGADLRCILTRGPGVMRKATVPLDGQLRRLLKAYFDNQRALREALRRA